MPKSTKDRIEELDKLNHLLADNLADAIWLMNARTLTYEYITPSIFKISGYTPDELLNTTIMDRLAPESVKKSTALLAKVIRQYKQGNKSARKLELELTHKNGGTYWVEIRAKIIVDPDNSPKIVGITRDITARKRAEQQQADVNRKLTEALADKEKLIQEIRVLEKLLPICSGCKRIRDEDGKWWPMEAYVREHTESDFTHTICADCKNVLYPDLEE